MSTKAQLETRIEELKERCQELGKENTKREIQVINLENELAFVKQRAENKAVELVQAKQNLIVKLQTGRAEYLNLRDDYREVVKTLRTVLKRAANGDLSTEDERFPVKW